MDFNGEFEVESPRKAVYSFVTDPEKLSACIPGFKSAEIKNPDEFSVVVKMGVAFIKGDFMIDMKFLDKIENKHAKVSGTGKGLGGSIDLNAVLDLSDQNGKTLMTWKASALIGGKLASLGQRIMNRQADKMIAEMFESLKKALS